MAAQRGPSNPMLIDQEGKFYTKLLSREMISLQLGEAYYGDGVLTGSVPFAWESQPGIPIATATTAMAVPSLSSPPSYFCPPNCGKMKKKKKKKKKISSFKSITAILVMRLRWRRKSKLRSSSWPSSPSHCSEPSCCLQNDGYRRLWPEEMEDKVEEQMDRGFYSASGCGGALGCFWKRTSRPRLRLENSNNDI